MSAVYRAPIFFVTSLKAGWQAAVSAMFAETVFRVITSGFYGAFTQGIRKLEPAWLSVAIVLILAPLAVQVMEFAVHRVSGTANLKTGIVVSTAMTAIASLFNWYAMRRGAMLTGKESRSFGEDLRQFPTLIVNFVMEMPKALLQKTKS